MRLQALTRKLAMLYSRTAIIMIIAITIILLLQSSGAMFIKTEKFKYVTMNHRITNDVTVEVYLLLVINHKYRSSELLTTNCKKCYQSTLH